MLAPLAAAVACLGASCALAQLPRHEDRFGLGPTVATLQHHVGATAASERTVAGSAWLLMAFGATGSTLRSGPAREQMKHLVVGLRDGQTADGRFAPCQRRDQLLATLAVCEVATISHYQLLKPTWQRAARATELAFAAPDAAAIDGTDAGLLALLAQRVAEAGEGELADRLRALVRPTVPATNAPRSRRDDAGRMLARQLLGVAEPPDLVAAVVWPPDLATDPLHAFLAVQALTPHRAELVRRLEPLERLARGRAANPADATAWPAAEGLDATTTTAILTTVLAQAGTWVADQK